ncbi:hypothetical protein IFM89_017278 [Coptis chinensis]|uniref:Uncharacterized protein n=1 Tax=Coptis chinensis TaxID=261450 RepID=A0A835ICZ7_9MAGN|nr:hypothetical protein IFM89_017278 [Coptis chinensis]
MVSCGGLLVVPILSSSTTFPDFSSLFPSTKTPKFGKFRAALSNFQPADDDGAQQFVENNSIADFMRYRRSGDKDSELQTAVVSYRKKFPWSILQPFLQVDLVSTIHIADKEYFAVLQKELESYDCVLYEMVASKESLENRRITSTTKRLKVSRSRGFNILGCIQRQMARLLTLDFQLDCLDYQSENWYHADLDFETFKLLQFVSSSYHGEASNGLSFAVSNHHSLKVVSSPLKVEVAGSDLLFRSE